MCHIVEPIVCTALAFTVCVQYEQQILITLVYRAKDGGNMKSVLGDTSNSSMWILMVEQILFWEHGMRGYIKRGTIRTKRDWQNIRISETFEMTELY